MKNKVINKCMNYIKSSNLTYTEEQLEEIAYGLEAIYIFITKMCILFLIAYFLNIWKELFIFLLIYSFIRMPSFGLHASSSMVCLISSILMFFGGIYISIYCTIPLWIRIMVGIYCIIRVYMNAPADTYKRPIINKKRRDTYKFISTILAILFTLLSILMNDIFLQNSFIISLCIQVFMISPVAYKLFKVPYNNFKQYTLNTV